MAKKAEPKTPPKVKKSDKSDAPKAKRLPRHIEESQYITVDQMRQILNINIHRVNELLDKRAFRWCWVGEQRRTTRTELHRFMECTLDGSIRVPGFIDITPPLQYLDVA